MTAGKNEAGEGASLDWRDEFQDSALEALYRRTMQLQDAQQLRYALWIIAGTFLLFGAADYILLGASLALLALLLVRFVVASSCLALARLIGRHSAQAHRPRPLNLVYCIAISGLLVSILLHPGSVGLHISSVAISSLAIYLLVPNRLPWILAWNGYLAGGFVLVVALWKPLAPGMLISSLLILAFANLMGWLTYSRLNRLQRKQFALLVAEREINRKLQKEIEERQLLEAQLRHMASTDPLTGIANRRHFFELAEREFRRAQRDGTPLTICMVDIDLFKTLNDHHGHAVGDLVLTTVASCCASMLRETDIIGRYGGEEFVIALPQADLETASFIAERLRHKVTSLRLPMLDEDQHLSVTVGISQVEPGEARLEQALQRADDALYAGKARGRNCVVVAGEAPSSIVARV
ncbi:GGDEF domain-containing protein [Halomonas sp. MCCC 1A17488]|uniref:diguanylate cyclase n=1 Tax=Billgrantia sulfidoxydans TaxID=2733484 RepID=A0ABX7W6R3_9GAMM|nr:MULTISPECIES: GGDEF domain-containing protein [Halomonas]MCE8015578.1 GGDEF domain-containing protein [Halomonas sp. MCCC 1A17488]MCG3238911.1 GGDEF domain-containing protein [Halomonas sp. MCCC 1A17488]QPP51133.1 GGDEF domain-containing protein [Halomonas sp. SS10-MC5]QTP54703.1 GGDEF domain-containing protein [Halomonas sulfidoxydans]